MYKLEWQTFQTHSVSLNRELYKDVNFTDVTLMTDDLVQVPAHKVILSAASTVLKELCLAGTRGAQQILYLRGVKQVDLEAVLQFIYLGEAAVYEDRLKEFSKIVKDFNITKLNDFEYIREKIQKSPNKSKLETSTDSNFQETMGKEKIITKEKEVLNGKSKKNGKIAGKLKRLVKKKHQSRGIQNVDEGSQCSSTLNPETKDISVSETPKIEIDGYDFTEFETIDESTSESLEENNFSLEVIREELIQNIVDKAEVESEFVAEALAGNAQHQPQCFKCHKSFVNKESLAEHFRTDYSNENYHCPDKGCDEQFEKKESLKNHLNSYHKEFKYKCSICNIQFTKESIFRNHNKRVHSVA